MSAHVPVVYRNTDARGNLMISCKNDGESKGKLDEQWANGTSLKTGIILLFQFFGLVDVELNHGRLPLAA